MRILFILIALLLLTSCDKKSENRTQSIPKSEVDTQPTEAAKLPHDIEGKWEYLNNESRTTGFEGTFFEFKGNGEFVQISIHASKVSSSKWSVSGERLLGKYKISDEVIDLEYLNCPGIFRAIDFKILNTQKDSMEISRGYPSLNGTYQKTETPNEFFRTFTPRHNCYVDVKQKSKKREIANEK